jgi:hypothetical protein
LIIPSNINYKLIIIIILAAVVRKIKTKAKEYREMERNPGTIDGESSIKFQGSSFECFDSTVKIASVWIIPIGIRLHLFNLNHHIFKW